jgi:hypothetical protein
MGEGGRSKKVKTVEKKGKTKHIAAEIGGTSSGDPTCRVGAEAL